MSDLSNNDREARIVLSPLSFNIQIKWMQILWKICVSWKPFMEFVMSAIIHSLTVLLWITHLKQQITIIIGHVKSTDDYLTFKKPCFYLVISLRLFFLPIFKPNRKKLEKNVPYNITLQNLNLDLLSFHLCVNRSNIFWRRNSVGAWFKLPLF